MNVNWLVKSHIWLLPKMYLPIVSYYIKLFFFWVSIMHYLPSFKYVKRQRYKFYIKTAHGDIRTEKIFTKKYLTSTYFKRRTSWEVFDIFLEKNKRKNISISNTIMEKSTKKVPGFKNRLIAYHQNFHPYYRMESLFTFVIRQCINSI